VEGNKLEASVRQLGVIWFFAVRPGDKPRPRPYFTRGPAIRYNRWLAGQQGLPYAK